MDIKKIVEEIVAKLKGDDKLLENFKSDPLATVKKLVGIDLPTDQLQSVVDGVKSKIRLDGITDKLGGIGDAIGGLFGGKKD